MSVIGIDLGTTSSSVSIFRNESVELLSAEQTNRQMPSCVAFAGQERLLGERALAQLKDNPKNTICDVKTLIGLTYEEGLTQKMVRNWPFDLEKDSGKLTIVVQYEGTKRSFYPEEITSMILSRLWNNAQEIVGEKLTGAVITVPAAFNHVQRKATMDAAKIAEIPVLGLINEPTAAALAYRQQITARKEIETERKVLILHMGGGAFNVSVIIVSRDSLEVKASIGKSQLGGRDFDDLLVNHFASEFSKKERRDLRDDSKATCKLRLACQTAKKNLSVAENVRVAIKSLYRGIDFQSSINLKTFWKLNSNIFTTIILTIQKVLEEANLNPEEIDDILTVGNSTRLPIFATIMEKYCGLNPKKMRQTIKPDEAAVRGAALMAAVLRNEQNSQSAGRIEKTISLIPEEIRDVLPNTVIIEMNNGPQLLLCIRGFNFSCRKATNLDLSIHYTKFELKCREPILVITKESCAWKEEIRSMSEITMSCDESTVHKVNFKINGSGLIEIMVDDKVSTFTPDEKCGVPAAEMQQLIAVSKSLRLEEKEKNKIKNELYELESDIYQTQRRYGCEVNGLNELIDWIQKASGLSLDDIEAKKKELERLKASLNQAKMEANKPNNRFAKWEDKEKMLMSQMASLFRTLGIMDPAAKRQILSAVAEVKASHGQEQKIDISQEQLNALFKDADKEIKRLQNMQQLPLLITLFQTLGMMNPTAKERISHGAEVETNSARGASESHGHAQKINISPQQLIDALNMATRKIEELQEDRYTKTTNLTEKQKVLQNLQNEFDKLQEENLTSASLVMESVNSLSAIPNELKKSQDRFSRLNARLEKVKDDLQTSKEENSSMTTRLEEVKNDLLKSEDENAKKVALLKEKEDLIKKFKDTLEKSPTGGIKEGCSSEEKVSSTKKKDSKKKESSKKTAIVEKLETELQEFQEEKPKETAFTKKKESTTKKEREKDGNSSKTERLEEKKVQELKDEKSRNATLLKEKDDTIKNLSDQLEKLKLGGKSKRGIFSREKETSTKKRK